MTGEGDEEDGEELDCRAPFVLPALFMIEVNIPAAADDPEEGFPKGEEECGAVDCVELPKLNFVGIAEDAFAIDVAFVEVGVVLNVKGDPEPEPNPPNKFAFGFCGKVVNTKKIIQATVHTHLRPWTDQVGQKVVEVSAEPLVYWTKHALEDPSSCD